MPETTILFWEQVRREAGLGFGTLFRMLARVCHASNLTSMAPLGVEEDDWMPGIPPAK